MDPNQTAQQNSFAPANPQYDHSQQSTQPYAVPAGNKPGQMGGLDNSAFESVTTIQQPEIHRRYENAPQAPEVARPVEIPQQPEMPVQNTQSQQPEAVQTQQQHNADTAAPKAGIVDQRKTVAKLHHLENITDTLTSLADQEEEEFIQNVESAHGVK